jgi:endonuclease YncB( thermonuclease family)
MSLRKTFGSFVFGALVVAMLSLASAGFAGDSVYGTITAVKRADLVTFDYGGGAYDIRLAGVEIPKDPALAAAAATFVSDHLLNKNCRLRFEGRTSEGEKIGRLITDDPDYGIKDIGLELVRNGYVSWQRSYVGYKYDEMKKAEDQARIDKRGMWK